MPPVKGAQRGSNRGNKGGSGKDDEAKPSRMMKIQNSSHGGKAVKQHSPHQIWYAGSGNVRAVWDGLVVADEEEAEKAMRKLTRWVLSLWRMTGSVFSFFQLFVFGFFFPRKSHPLRSPFLSMFPIAVTSNLRASWRHLKSRASTSSTLRSSRRF